MIEQLRDALHIHLSRVMPTSVLDAAALNATERQKADRFVFAHDRQLYIAAHLFLRRTLSLYAPIAPGDWIFNANTHGKPAIANPDYQSIQFNLSHTQGLIGVALTLNRAVGVDVERGDRPLRNLASLSRYVLTQHEAADVLSSDDPAAQRHKFFTYWTLKEAYIKARGMGIASLPPQSFSFNETLSDSQKTLSQWQLACQPDAQTKQWLYQTRTLTHNYFLAYVVEAGIDPTAIKIHAADDITKNIPLVPS